MRVIVVGGGVMGCATALELVERGVHDVLVLERAVPGAEASSAAAGMLAAQIEAHDERERTAFVRARDGYAAWAAHLLEQTGVSVGYRKSGALSVARSLEAAAPLEAAAAAHRASGLRAELVDGARAREIEPDLAADVPLATYYPDEAQVDPPQLLRALVAAIARSRVSVKSGATVTEIVFEGERCVGVRLGDHEIIRGDAVVLAAGSWSSLVPGLPEGLPRVRPMRGQLVMLEERPPRLRTIVFDGHGYVVPRGDGRVVCGSTMEDVGHRREVTAEGVRSILERAVAIAPTLGKAELARTWCNFRPSVTRDGAIGTPLVGASGRAGLYMATGHHRNGILLAKVTAEAVADAILTAR